MLRLNDRKIAAILLCGVLLLLAPGTVAGAVPYVPPLKWSPDGSYVARVVGTTIEVWDAASNQVLHELDGHTDFIPMVAWSPDSTRLASPSSDQTVRVWRASDGALLHTLIGHHEAVTAVTWTPDGDRLLSFGFDSNPSLFVWDATAGTLLSKHEEGTIAFAEYSPDGERLALATTLTIDILDGSTLDRLTGMPWVACCVNQFASLMWSPGETLLTTGSLNGLVTLWDASNLQLMHQFVANSHHAADSRDVANLALSWVRAVTFSGDGQTVLAVSGDGTVRAWDTTSGTLLEEAHVPPLMNAAWSPDGTRLAYEDRQGAMQFVASPINVTTTPTAAPPPGAG